MKRQDGAESDEISVVGIIRILISYARVLGFFVLGCVVAAILFSAIYYWVQPERWVASVSFRPVFEGADDGEYPNGLPFGPGDIVASSVLDKVYHDNNIKDFCPSEQFRSGFFVEETSPEIQFLDFDYQSRLADSRLTVVERERIQAEYRQRRAAMPRQFRLTFIRPPGCSRLPPAVVSKALNDVLETWASESVLRRGVLKLAVPVYSQAVFDVVPIGTQSPLIRADLIRKALKRVLSNIDDIEKLPGAPLIRLTTDQVSLAELRARLEDLEAHIDPLMTMAGGGIEGSTGWVQESLQNAELQKEAWQARSEAYLQALREYSGTSTLEGRPQTPGSNSDVQSLTPQIDSTFIDRIVQMSEKNTGFRQELTRLLVTASTTAVLHSSDAAHYARLLAAARSPGALPADVVNRQLDQIVAAAKALVGDLQKLYDELSAVALRPGGSLFQTTTGVITGTSRPFSFRQAWTITLGVALAAALIGAILSLLHYKLRQT